MSAGPRCCHPVLVACRMLLALSLLTGVVYPLLVTGIATVLMPRQASGSMVVTDSQPVGSDWLAQRFGSDRYFWSRPSAGDNGTNYATIPSSASNLGPTSSNLASSVRSRIERFRSAHHLPQDSAVPAEMVFASASGLDPHISPTAARLQIQRVARARAFDPEKTVRLRQLVEQAIEPPQFGLLGEPRVNVLHLNLRLDRLP